MSDVSEIVKLTDMQNLHDFPQFAGFVSSWDISRIMGQHPLFRALMDSREQFLIREHKEAAAHYKWAVGELQRLQREGRDLETFRRTVVAPAREHCQALFRAWLAEYRQL